MRQNALRISSSLYPRHEQTKGQSTDHKCTLSVGAPRKSGSTTVIPITDEAALEKIINELPEKPFLIGTEVVSMSLAGVQDKLPVYMLVSGSRGVPTDGTPSTHIFKPTALKTRRPSHPRRRVVVLAAHDGRFASFFGWTGLLVAGPFAAAHELACHNC